MKPFGYLEFGQNHERNRSIYLSYTLCCWAFVLVILNYKDWSKEDEGLVSWSNWSEKIKIGMFGQMVIGGPPSTMDRDSH